MGAQRHDGAEMTQKNVHSLKLDRLKMHEDEIGGFIQRWWRGRSKQKIGHEFVDSFTMQSAPATGGSEEKGLAQTCFILDIKQAQFGSKLHSSGSGYFVLSGPGL